MKKLKNKKYKMYISDEELSQNRLKPYNENIASFAGYVDRKVGFTTKLLNISYNYLSSEYLIEYEHYEE